MHPSAQHRYSLFAYEHKIKGSGAPGNRACINGNITVQWCDIPGWELARSTKREHTAGHLMRHVGVGAEDQRSGCSENDVRARKQLTVLCLMPQGKQDQWPNGTEPAVAKSNFVTSSDKGRGKGLWSTAEQKATSRSGQTQTAAPTSRMYDFVLTELTKKL